MFDCIFLIAFESAPDGLGSVDGVALCLVGERLEGDVHQVGVVVAHGQATPAISLHWGHWGHLCYCSTYSTCVTYVTCEVS